METGFAATFHRGGLLRAKPRSVAGLIGLFFKATGRP
jgi:hypothetical protein